MPLTTINDGKERAEAYRPVLFCDFLFPDGTAYYVASIAGTFNGHVYEARIDDQQIDRLSSLSEQGIDRVPSITVSLADPTGSVFATYERGKGFKGATLTLRLALADLSAGTFSTDNFVPFVGICDQPSSDDKVLTVSAQSSLNLSNFMLPSAPIQVTCIWCNPTTAAQRATADDPTSNFYPCGESRDLATAPPCAYTKQTCTRPNRYSGSTWQPAQTDTGTEYVSGKTSSWHNADTSGKYKEYWPVWLGGKAWVECVSLNQWGDGNYARGEAAVGIGQVLVSRVIVNGVELSQGGKDYFWGYSNNGARDGAVNTDAEPGGGGDPYGGLTVIEYRAPKAVISPETPATVQVLGERSVDGHTTVQSSTSIASANAGSGGNPGPIVIHFGRTLGTYDPGDGSAITITGCGFTAANGSWTMRLLESPYDHATLQGSMANGSGSGGTLYYNQITQSGGGPTPGILQEALRQCGIGAAKLSGPAFSTANAICNTSISTTDGSGNTYTQNRFSSAVAVRQRRSAADIVRGLRQSIGSLLTIDGTGLIQIKVEGPLAEQQPAAVDGSNNTTPIVSVLRNGTVANGFTAYRFDESNAWNLKRDPQQTAQMPNRVTFSFQDPTQQYALSTFSLVDSDDVSRVGREVPGGLQVNPEGIASYNHALRCARLGLNKIHRGNPSSDTRGTDWWEWRTSFRACKLRIGDLVTLNSTKYNLVEQLVRITEIKPSKNFETVDLKGHSHNDSWYLDSHGNSADPFYDSTPHVGVGVTVPPSFAVEVSALDSSTAEVTGLTFTDLTNAYSISAGTFTFFYVIDGTPLTTLAAPLGASDLSVNLIDASDVSEGDCLQIGSESVLCGTPAGGVVPITRGQLGSTAATEVSGAQCWKVQQRVATVGFPLDFVNSAAAPDWALMQSLPDTRLVSVGGSVTNAYGESAVAFVCVAGNAAHGIELSTQSDTSARIVNVTNANTTLTPGNQFVSVVATTQDVIITMPAESADVGDSVTVKRALGSTHNVKVRPGSGDTVSDSASDFVISQDGESHTWMGQ